MAKKDKKIIKNICIVINPSSGQTSIIKRIEEIILLLAVKGIRANYTISTSKTDLITLSKQAAQPGLYDLLVAVGGDGTLRDVLTSVVGYDIPVSVIPAGTGNVFAKEMKIPFHSKKWVKMITRAKRCKVDGGLVNGSYFIMMAGVGFDAFTVKNTESLGIKKIFGKISYIAGFLKSISEYSYPPLQIEVDDTIHDSGYGVIISNTSRYGVYFSLNPAALCNDGFLDCVIYRQRGIFGFLGLFITAYFAFLGAGKKVKLRGNIRRYRCKKIKITSENKHLPVQIDGDLSGVLPAEISVSKHSFEMMLPSKTVKRLMASQKKIVL